MSYPYGTQGAPAVGAGAPGLPQRTSNIGADPAGPPLQRLVIRPGDLYSQTPFFTPDWATFVRVTALGLGGRGLGGTSGLTVGGTGAHGGAGAGLAGTNIVAVTPGTPVNISFGPTATLVGILGYQLSAGNGGDASTSAGGAPGIGSGGDVNFNGGAGGTTTSTGAGSGGGAAGRGGNGAAGTTSLATGGNNGLGDTYTTGGGAGGAGQEPGGIRSAGAILLANSPVGALLLGRTLSPTGAAAPSCDGGDGGGGSGGTNVSATSNMPGAGLVLIELW